ncbi:MAG: hypothetical protein JW889_11755 [Verrucomicrobia bacterium]|nr:hypothetical protein [Verrucomicrobiota bacterium]
MKRIPLLMALVLVVLALGLFGGCGKPGMAEDESDLPWATPEDWEGGMPIGIGG